MIAKSIEDKIKLLSNYKIIYLKVLDFRKSYEQTNCIPAGLVNKFIKKALLSHDFDQGGMYNSLLCKKCALQVSCNNVNNIITVSINLNHNIISRFGGIDYYDKQLNVDYSSLYCDDIYNQTSGMFDVCDILD